MVCKNRGIYRFLGPSWVLNTIPPRNTIVKVDHLAKMCQDWQGTSQLARIFPTNRIAWYTVWLSYESTHRLSVTQRFDVYLQQ